MKANLAGIHVAILAADGFEQLELTSPQKYLEQHGAGVEIISLKRGHIRGMNMMLPGKKVAVDHTIDSVDPVRYDALFIPGGFVNPDKLRQSDVVLEFVRAFNASGKPIGVICHAPWVLASAGLVVGRTLTSWPGIKDDLRNAGADWHDKAVVEDDNWISGRGPQDLGKFNPALAKLFAARATHSLPVAPPRRSFNLGGWLGGGLALAGIGYAARWYADRERSENQPQRIQ
ncbi:MAG: type 1 glutamine amidotransferase [Chloroflexales bacterium]|nr:type 1 glutamine amidotransferase [Chloroflexales bacterium]